MAIQAKKVYEMALALIDEVLETGDVVADQPEYYEAKALHFLTTLQAELLPVSQTPVAITDIKQELLLPDRTALLVLPYGLAAHLLLQEDINTASFFNARYDELKRKTPTNSQPITDVYGIVGGMQ